MKRITIALALALAFAGPAAEARPFTNSAGRTVEVPDRIAHVLPAGPPASIILYMLAPDQLVGWIRAPSAAERAFLPPRYAELPEVGRLTGRGNTSSVEDVVRLAPDLVLDIGSTTATYVSLADRVQEQTHIPDVLIDGKLENAAATFRTVGALLGVREHAEELARYAEETLTEVRRRTEQLPSERRLKVYFARGANGLETGARGSINIEALDFVAVHDVSAENSGGRRDRRHLAGAGSRLATGRDRDRQSPVLCLGLAGSGLAERKGGARQTRLPLAGFAVRVD